MLPRKPLTFWFCVISTFVFGLRQLSCSAADQQDWPDDQFSTRHMFLLLADAEISKELSITNEQRNTLRALESELRPRFSQAVRPEKGLSSKSEAEQEAAAKARQAKVSALEQEFRPQTWKTLTATQQERVIQILRQLNVFRAISEDSKVTAAIVLEAEQKAAMRKISDQYKDDLRNNYAAVRSLSERADLNEAAETKRDDQLLKLLTAEQQSKWSTLTGKPLKVADLRPRINLFRTNVDRARIAKSQEESEKKPTLDQ